MKNLLEGALHALENGHPIEGDFSHRNGLFEARVMFNKRPYDNPLTEKTDRCLVSAFYKATQQYLAHKTHSGKKTPRNQPMHFPTDGGIVELLSRWLLNPASRFIISKKDEIFVVELRKLALTDIPRNIKFQLDSDTEEVSLKWVDRGFTYKSCKGDGCYPTTVIDIPTGKKYNDAWSFKITKNGNGENIVEAFENAFKAESIEVEK